MKRSAAAGVAGILAIGVGGCAGEPAAVVRTPANPHIFDATGMRLHPVFTKVSDFDGDGKPDGIEAAVQFQDQFGDPTKAVGRIIFELNAFKQYSPDPHGLRLSAPFEGRLDSLQDQKARWNNAIGAYIFQLAYPDVKLTTDYVVTATFEPLSGGRFIDTDIIEGDHTKPGAATQPGPLTTRPSTQASNQSTTAPTTAASVQESTSAPAHQPPARSDQP